MQISDIPAKFALPFASSAAAPYIRTIPQTPSGTPGQAALTTGFPPENFSPVAAGGVPPFGADFNGVLNQTTAWNRWSAAGVAFPLYDATFQTAIGGYPRSAIVMSLVQDGLLYYCLVDNNITNPDTGGAGWMIWLRRLTTNTDLYVNGATGNDSNNGLTLATATKTIHAAMNLAWTFPPSSAFSITIHVADGTYPESVATPLIPGPAVILTGNAGIPSNVTVSSSGASTILVQGPNTLTVQNLKVTNSASNAAGFSATTSGTMITSNTVSGACAGWVFLGNGGGTIFVGAHSFTASCGYLFAAYLNGSCILSSGVSYTIAGGGITVTDSAIAVSGGNVQVPGTSPPNFTGGIVTGARYSATLNGIINSQGAGINYFPGTVAGTTATGGQYGV